MNAFHKIRKELDLHEPISYRNLAIFPLIKKTTHTRPYITLADALSGGEFRITEVKKAPSFRSGRLEYSNRPEIGGIDYEVPNGAHSESRGDSQAHGGRIIPQQIDDCYSYCVFSI